VIRWSCGTPIDIEFTRAVSSTLGQWTSKADKRVLGAFKRGVEIRFQLALQATANERSSR